MQRIFQLTVPVGQIELVEEEEEDAVTEHTRLVMFGVDDRAKEVEVVDEEEPLKDQHLMNIIGAQWWAVGQDGNEL